MSGRRLLLRSIRHRGSRERGSTLVIVLVFVVVVSISGVAVLDLAEVSYKAQAVYVDKAEMEHATLNAITEAVEIIGRDEDGLMGRDAPGRARCADPAREEELYRFADPDDPTTFVEVRCRPERGSGHRPNGDADLPEHVIMTLGGAQHQANTQATTTDDAIPFCDDWHNRDGGACEAGLYVGRVDGTATGDSGLLIGGNGNGTGKPLVVSNSSIIVREGDQNRRLVVEGGVEARNGCTTDLIRAHADSGGSPPNCRNGRPLVTLDPDDPGNVAYLPDQARIRDLRIPGERFGRLRETAVPPCTPTSGPAAGLDTGFVVFSPGYYSDLVSLNHLMDNCGDSLFYFEPGLYYFDFGNKEPAAWTEPRGANGKLSQLVAGSIPPASDPHAWLPCNIGQSNPAPAVGLSPGECPEQPTKTMFLNRAANSLGNSSGMGVWKNPELATAIDGRFGEVRTNNNLGWFRWKEPQVRLPVRSGTTVKALSVRIAHQTPSATSPNTTYLAGYPLLKVMLPGGAYCELPLTDPGVPLAGRDQIVTHTFTLLSDYGRAPNPCAAQTIGWSANLDTVVSTPAKVNDITLEYQVKSQRSSTEISAYVDGVEIDVVYRGRPAPDFPGGCDAKQNGVQWVFGNTSRMRYVQNNAFVEICGYKGGAEHGGQYAIALYGTPEHAADPPATWRSDVGARRNPSLGNNKFPSMDDPSAAAARLATVDDGAPPFVSEVWSDSGTAKVSFLLPDDLVTKDDLPAGSIITGVELRVRHAEGAPPTPEQTVTDTSKITSVSLSISPGFSGEGSNFESPEPISFRLPKCGDFTMPTGDPAPRGANACDFRFGYFTEGPDGPVTSRTPTAGSTNPWWGGTKATPVLSDNRHRQLLDALDTPESINGAEIRFEVAGAGGFPKQVYLDGVELVVHFRPLGTVRPLRKCLTTRSAANPYASGPNPMVGTDRDWAPPNDNSRSDRAYTSGTGQVDSEACALVQMLSDQDSGVKLHIRGMVYAPTAALDLAGKDNEAPFVTDGIVVRHVTVWRWKKGPMVYAFGGTDPDRKNRRVELSAWRDGVEIWRVRAEYDDRGGANFGRSQAFLPEVLLRPEASP